MLRGGLFFLVLIGIIIANFRDRVVQFFITGDMSIDNDWATYLSEMDKMDVNGYIATMQEAYDSYAASLKK